MREDLKCVIKLRLFKMKIRQKQQFVKWTRQYFKVTLSLMCKRIVLCIFLHFLHIYHYFIIIIDGYLSALIHIAEIF